MDVKSDSDAIIRVLALEILLKCVLCISSDNTKKKYGHHYSKIWDSGLPVPVKAEILRFAEERTGPRAHFGDADRQRELLLDFQFVFEQARYNYELYEGVSISDQISEGERWIARGAPVEDACVRYHPYELMGLLHGLNRFIEEWLISTAVD